MNKLHQGITEALKSLPPFRKVVVGLSGGRDSVALTHALKSLGYEVVAAHLNHQLRGEASDADEAFVIELAKKWKLPCLTKKAVIPKTGNLEHNARAIRYAFL
jgi:tRNA(Ile)-lysidine synthase